MHICPSTIPLSLTHTHRRLPLARPRSVQAHRIRLDGPPRTSATTATDSLAAGTLLTARVKYTHAVSLPRQGVVRSCQLTLAVAAAPPSATAFSPGRAR